MSGKQPKRRGIVLAMEAQSKSVPDGRAGWHGVTCGAGSGGRAPVALRRCPPGVARVGGSVACAQQLVWGRDETYCGRASIDFGPIERVLFNDRRQKAGSIR